VFPTSYGPKRKFCDFESPRKDRQETRRHQNQKARHAREGQRAECTQAGLNLQHFEMTVADARLIGDRQFDTIAPTGTSVANIECPATDFP
jgi:hypothetical protein